MEINTIESFTKDEQEAYIALSSCGQRAREEKSLVAAALINLTRGGKHVNAEAIAVEAFGLLKSAISTVYRNLKLFEENGLIVRRYFDTDRAYYELNLPTHAHLINTTKGGKGEIQHIELSDSTRKELEMIAVKKGMNLTKIDIMIYAEETKSTEV